MSGRLIILPKKSWHPGKRENIEKVLRDERLAAEEAAASRERAREITQEGIVEILSKKRSAAEQNQGEALVAGNSAGRKRKRQGEDGAAQPLGGKGQGWGATPQHVNLFSEAEREAGKLLGQNADHQREKQEQELRAQQRSGLAPTALGEGSAELMDRDSQPWYTLANACVGAPDVAARAVRLGREVTGQEAEAVMKRDEGRKGRADPMGSLFRSSTQAPLGSLAADKTETAVRPGASPIGLLRRSGGDSDGAVPRSDGHKRPEKREKEKDKKHKKHKKHKQKKKSFKEGRRRSNRDCRKSHGGDPAGANDSGGDADETTDTTRQQALEELRRRRLAREVRERERQTRLLAEREMAGQSLPDERSMAYNNQYNASAATQNRMR